MAKIKLKYTGEVINVTPASFGKKIAKAMDDIASSNVFFIVQQAYGEIDYSEVQQIFAEVLKGELTDKDSNQ